ncbi:MAG: hypothetical protein ABIF09_13920 [Gemmatimonadota bacterium]
MSHDLSALRLVDLEIADESRLNLLWIEGFIKGGSALEISVPGLPLRPALEALFDKVTHIPASSENVSGRACRIPAPNQTFDLVTLYGRRPSLPTLREILRVLRPSGVLYLAVRNRWWYGRVRVANPHPGSRGLFGGPRLVRTVRAVGFSVVRQYYLDPSLATPRDFIPAHRPSLATRELTLRKEGETGPMRRAFVQLGLFGFLYPGRLILARV